MASLDDVKADVAARLDETVSVIVGRKGADGEVDAAKLAIADDAAQAFRDLARESLEDLGRRQSVPYTVDAELDRGEVFVLDDADDLAELADLTELAELAATLPITAPRDLDLGIQFYAVVLGDTTRLTFVRRTDPRISFRSGRWLAIAGQQLTKLEEPAFSFSPGFDFLLGPGWAVILSQASFERLFRDIGLIDKHVQGWVEGISDHLPMDPTSEAELLRVAREDSRTWRRLREIRRRGHLANIELGEVRKYARKVGLDPKTVIQDGKLVFDPAERFSFLHLLNEDLYRGDLTNTTFEAQRKAAAGT
ncbi:MAG: Kiwa anti-phage protein KwaB-like domain-containing protein [Acidimicrobiales bacterium]